MHFSLVEIVITLSQADRLTPLPALSMRSHSRQVANAMPPAVAGLLPRRWVETLPAGNISDIAVTFSNAKSGASGPALPLRLQIPHFHPYFGTLACSKSKFLGCDF